MARGLDEEEEEEGDKQEKREEEMTRRRRRHSTDLVEWPVLPQDPLHSGREVRDGDRRVCHLPNINRSTSVKAITCQPNYNYGITLALKTAVEADTSCTALQLHALWDWKCTSNVLC